MNDVTIAATSAKARRSAKTEPGFHLLAFALFGGVTFWVIHLVGSTALVAPACSHGLVWIINALTVVTALIVVGAIAAGARVHRYGATSINPGRTRLLGELAILFNIASLLLIVLEGYPVVVLDACSR